LLHFVQLFDNRIEPCSRRPELPGEWARRFQLSAKAGNRSLQFHEFPDKIEGVARH
jgi:hypothetical protein